MQLSAASVCRAARVLAWAIAFAPVALYAQSSAFTFDKVPVHRADTVFASSVQTSYQLGGTLALPVGVSKEARNLFRLGFQIRVFRVSGASALPEPLRAFAPCEVYLTSVFDIPGSNASEANVAKFVDHGWLDFAPGRSPKTAHFLLVVEGRRDGEAMFRLDTSGKQRYFEGALRFEVRADRQLMQAEIAEQWKRIGDYLVEAQRQAGLNRPDIRCFQLQARYGTDEEELLAYALPPCGQTVEANGTH